MVGAFNQEKALVGAFSVIVQLYRLIVHNITWMLMPKPGTGLHSSWAGAAVATSRHKDAKNLGSDHFILCM